VTVLHGVGSNPGGKSHPGSGFLESGWPDRPPRRTGKQTIKYNCNVYAISFIRCGGDVSRPFTDVTAIHPMDGGNAPPEGVSTL